MRYFVDTEFHWIPTKGMLCPISIALVAEDGREYYAYCADFRNNQPSHFVEDQVLSVLQSVGVRDDILRFIGDDIPEFWGDYAAFDYVMLSMIFGEFNDWPSGWPMHVNDLQQESIPSLPSKVPHNALADARAIRDSFIDSTTRGAS